MAELSPRQRFLQITLNTLLHDVSDDEYVQDMLRDIIDFVRDDAKWNAQSAVDREETEELLTLINEQMKKVAESKVSVTRPETGELVQGVDTRATQSYRGGLINALFRLRTKAEAAAKEE